MLLLSPQSSVLITALTSDSEEAPLAGDSAEGVRAAILEVDAGAGDEVFDGAGDEDFAGGRVVAHGPADLDGEAAHALRALDEVALARVQPGARLDAEAGRVLRDGAGGAHRARRPVEGGERPLARHVHLAPAEPLDLLADVRAQAADQIVPARLAHRGAPRRTLGDVEEEHGGEHAVGLVRVADARQKLFDLVEDGGLIADKR